jgi:hypothetical protein
MIKQQPKMQVSRSQLFLGIFRATWRRIKSLDFPGGRVAVRDAGGYPYIHREHTRGELREMARLSARRDFRRTRGLPMERAQKRT